MKPEIDVKLIEEVIEELPSSLSVYDMDRLVVKLKQAITPQPQFYKGQQGMVSDNKTYWHRAILLSITKDSFIAQRGNNTDEYFKYFKPDPDALTLPVWLPYVADDFTPTCKGDLVISDNRTMYTIIPPYEVLS